MKLRISPHRLRRVAALHVLMSLAMALLAAPLARSQTYQVAYGPQTEWARYHPIERTADGGTIMVGTAQGMNGSKDVYLQKIGPTGIPTWQTALGSDKTDEEGYDVVESRDFKGQTLCYVVTGISVRNGFPANDTDIYAAKVWPSGVVAWQKWYGNLINGYTEIGNAITEIVNGYAIAGIWRDATVPNSSEAFLMTIDTGGAVTRAEKIGQRSIDDGAFGITYTGNEIGIAGYTMNTGKTDGMIVRVDPNTGGILGNPHRYGNLGNDDTLYSIEQVRGIYFVCAGTTGYRKDHMDMLGIEVEIATDNLIWGNTYVAFVNPNFNRMNMGADLQDIGETYGIVGTTSAALDMPPSLYPDYILLAKLKYTDGSTLPGPGAAKIYGGVSGNAMTSTGYGLRPITGINGRCLVAGQEDFATTLASGQDMYLIRTDANLQSGCNEGDPDMSFEVYTTNDYIFPTVTQYPIDTVPIEGQRYRNGDTALCFCAFCKHVIEPVGADAAGAEKLSLAITTDPASGDVSVQVRTPGDGVLEVFDMMGHRVRTLLRNVSASGNDAIVWDGTDDTGGRLPNGMYVIQLRTPAGSTSHPVRIVR
ncbi:MAG TPA: FlgD immunoglobulin-like domain containing protein [Candidatus Kapabacteria bacterium]|nr:FlgD immunoglobulin-like domain containing protein [Candidatus Kapabacteria bacterium]